MIAFVDGKPVEFEGNPRTTLTPCVACGALPSDPEPRDILEALDAF